LESETTFNSIRGKDDGSFLYLISQIETNDKNPFSRDIKAQFKVPKTADLISLKFQANKSQADSYYSIRDIHIIPGQERYITFISDSERTEHSIPLVSLTYSDRVKLDENLSSISTVTSKSLQVSKSLKVSYR
jgi:hypothetical protein